MMQMPKPGSFPMVAALAAVIALTVPALAAEYRFVVVVDHERDNFNQGSFACATINKHGEVAFKAARTVAGGFDSFDGTYRANTNGTITAIVEDPDRAHFTFTGNFTAVHRRFPQPKIDQHFGSSREANGYWKTTGRFRNQGMTWLGWSRAASRRIGLWQRLSKCTTIRSGWMSTTPAVSTNLRDSCLGAAVSKPRSCLASQR